MLTVLESTGVCNYHLQAFDFRDGVEANVCCESLDDAGYWLHSNGFEWTGRHFYREPANRTEKPLLARVKDRRTGRSFSCEDMQELVLPLFAFAGANR